MHLLVRAVSETLWEFTLPPVIRTSSDQQSYEIYASNEANMLEVSLNNKQK